MVENNQQQLEENQSSFFSVVQKISEKCDEKFLKNLEKQLSEKKF